MKLKQIAIWISLVTALSACNSTDATLGVEDAGTPASSAQATQPPVITPAPPSGQQAVAANTVRMRFAPIIGAPVDKVTPLSRRLSSLAKANAITIVASADQTATHVLKGYFSVLAEGSTSTVIYVFDVLDPSGNRMHRIQGQETATGSNAADSWAAVPPSLMESIADKAMGEFIKWLGAPNA